MKKLLLIAAVAASTATMSAETFSDFFKLTCGDQVIENGQTIIDSNYYDEYAEFGIPGVTNLVSQVKLKATNVAGESMDINCVMARTQPQISEQFPSMGSALGFFKLCYDFSNRPGTCLNIGEDNQISSKDAIIVDPDEYILFDMEQCGFTDLAQTTFKLDLWVTEGGEKVAGTDCTVYVNFTHETDITAAVDGVEVDAAPAEYFNLQGVKVAHPEKGGIYIVRKGSKVTKQLF